MKHFGSYNEFEFALAGRARVVFKDGSGGQSGGAPAGREVQPLTPEQLAESAVDSANTKYKADKKKLMDQIKAVLKNNSENEVIVAAAAEARLEISKLEKGKDNEGFLKPEQIRKNLTVFGNIINYFNVYPAVESTKKEIKKLSTKVQGSVENFFSEYMASIDANDKLSADAKNRIKTLATIRQAEVIGMISETALTDSVLNLKDYLLNPSLLSGIDGRAKRSKGLLDGSNKDLFDRIKKAEGEFEAEAGAIITLEDRDIYKKTEGGSGKVSDEDLKKVTEEDGDNKKELTALERGIRDRVTVKIDGQDVVVRKREGKYFIDIEQEATAYTSVAGAIAAAIMHLRGEKSKESATSSPNYKP